MYHSQFAHGLVAALLSDRKSQPKKRKRWVQQTVYLNLPLVTLVTGVKIPLLTRFVRR